MRLNDYINDYTNCNCFEINFKNNKLYIYNYDVIEYFSSSKIIITNKNNKYMIIGNNLSAELMIEDKIIINGTIKSILFGDINE